MTGASRRQGDEAGSTHSRRHEPVDAIAGPVDGPGEVVAGEGPGSCTGAGRAKPNRVLRLAPSPSRFVHPYRLEPPRGERPALREAPVRGPPANRVILPSSGTDNGIRLVYLPVMMIGF